MSQENVEIIRRVWEAAESRDTEAVFALYDPDVVWDASRIPETLAGVYHGHEGVRQFFQDWLESFEAHRTHAEGFLDAGDSVVVGFRIRARGKSSGAEVEMPRWNVYRIRNGLVIRVEVFESKAEALEAAGLPKDTHLLDFPPS